MSLSRLMTSIHDVLNLSLLVPHALKGAFESPILDPHAKLELFIIGLRKYPSPFIFSLESPVFIGGSEGEGCKSTLHHPSSAFKFLTFSDFGLQLIESCSCFY